jgi:hypothetical protein
MMRFRLPPPTSGRDDPGTWLFVWPERIPISGEPPKPPRPPKPPKGGRQPG